MIQNTKVFNKDDYPVKLMLLDIGVLNTDFWKKMSTEEQNNYFVTKIIPKVYSNKPLESNMEFLKQRIDFVYDAQTHGYSEMFDAVNMSFMVRFKTKSDYVLWKMTFKDDVGVLLDV